MSKKTEYELKIAIGGKVDNSLTKSVNEIKGQLGSMSSTIKTVVAGAAAVFTSVKLKDAFDDVTNASKEMGTSMAGVAKVVDGLKDENGKITKSYHEMKNAILELSTDVPMTAENISAIMEAAGQSNIAKEELLEFTETATKMGIAFDSTAEQAGDWMAAWRTALDLNQEEVTALADQINYLGNTTSENAIKISDVITRIGSLSKTANISASSVAAMAASMTKVESEVAATGIKNFSLALVAGDSATKRQILSYKKLGLSAKEVSKNMQIDSKATIIDVLERINKLSKEEQTSTMKDLFGSESLASIAPLASNLKNLKEQFEKVGDATLYAGSMEKEYIAASSTAANVDILTENKIQAAKIKIGDTLVSLSTLAAETKGNLADSLGDFFQKNAPEIQETVRNIQKSFEEFLPTAVTNIKAFGKETKKYIKPIFDLISDNPDLIPKFLTTTGTAMVTYKLGKNIGDIAKNVKLAGNPLKLVSGIITNPWALAIGATAGGIFFLAKSIADAKKELREADLASRFGDITLSLKDLGTIAQGIIKNDNFGKLSDYFKSTEAFEELNNSLNDTMAELKKYNWKLSIGLELTEEEKNSYKTAITNYITDSQNMLLEDRYRLNISMDLFTDESIQGNNIREKMNAFYNSNYENLNDLGSDLQKAVNDAFSDGLLTIDESAVISNYMQQMSDLNKQLADAEFEAKMTALGTEYTGTGLTADSFKNLQAELAEQVKESKQDYTQALANQIQSYKVAYTQGGLTPEEYYSAVSMAKESYLNQVSELEGKSFNFQYETILDAYSKEIKNTLPEFEEYIKETVGASMDRLAEDGMWGAELPLLLDSLKDYDGLDSTVKANLEKLFKEMLPSQEFLEQTRSEFIEAGKEVPQWINEGLKNSALLGALIGNIDSIDKAIGMQIAENDEYVELTKKAYKKGFNIGNEIIEGIEYVKPSVETSINDLLANIKESLEQGVSVKIPVNGRLEMLKVPDVPLYSQTFGKIHSNDKGNIVTKPILTTFAEEGPEAAIPLDGSKRAIDLWYTSGQILGLINRDGSNGQRFDIQGAYNRLSGNTTNNINNQPNVKFEYNINVESGADYEKVEKALLVSQSQFNKMMRIFQKEEGRLRMN